MGSDAASAPGREAPIIEVAKVSKVFRAEDGRARSFQELIVNLLGGKARRSRDDWYWALQGVSFTVKRGETLGIIGANGSGKSTCLKLLARILEPTSGEIAVNGRISALLELGAGFHPDLTGRENVFLSGSVLGFSRQEMRDRMDQIISFAEIERFIDVPVKFYSSGMYVRLAFAIAINVRPDVLLVDEVLSVGDLSYQDKCLERINHLKRRGVTIVFVSHSLDAVKSLCERTIWLEYGKLMADGPTDMVVAQYVHHVHQLEEERARATSGLGRESAAQDEPTAIEPEPEEAYEPDPEPIADADDELAQDELPEDVDPMVRYQSRWGSHEARITGISLLDRDGAERHALTTGQPASIVVHYQSDITIERPQFGLAIHRADGLHINGPNNVRAGFEIDEIQGSGRVVYHMDHLPLLEGVYYLTAALYDHSGKHAYDHRAHQFKFLVHGQTEERLPGAFAVPADWSHESDNVGPTP